MINLTERVQWFAAAMERKLRLNEHKGSWEDCDFDYLWRRLEEEMDELERAIEIGDPQAILDEAADVANYAMMISDVARMEGETGG